jgi:hypothetical protein
MVATLRSEVAQLPEYGATNGTGAGEGALLNVPMALNCTCPLGEVCASAVPGVITID